MMSSSAPLRLLLFGHPERSEGSAVPRLARTMSFRLPCRPGDSGWMDARQSASWSGFLVNFRVARHPGVSVASEKPTSED